MTSELKHPFFKKGMVIQLKPEHSISGNRHRWLILDIQHQHSGYREPVYWMITGVNENGKVSSGPIFNYRSENEDIWEIII